MDHKIILEGIKDATTSINNNADFLINHATNQLDYLDTVFNIMENNYSVLDEETYKNILLLEFETELLIKAIKLNREEIIVDESKIEIIKSNCDDLLTLIGKIKPIQNERASKFFKEVQGVKSNGGGF